MIDIDHIGAPAFIVAPRAGRFVYESANLAVARLAGLPLEGFVGRSPEEIFTPEVVRIVNANYAECVARREPVEFERAVALPSGERVIRTMLTPLLDPGGDNVQRMLGVSNDVTEQHRLREDLKRTNARFAVALDVLGGAYWYFDAARAHFELDASFDRMIGAAIQSQVSMQEWLTHVHPDDRQDTCFAEILAGQREEGNVDFRVIGDGGETRWLRCRRRAVRQGTALLGITGIVVDVTQEKQREQALSREASTDPLTDLANRRAFEHALAAECQPGRAGPMSVLIADVDYFKGYNDTYGHLEGDVILRRLAGCFRQVVEGAGGGAARFGGEEFVAVLPGRTASEAADVARAILEAVDELAIPHAASPRAAVTVSIGVSSGQAGPGGQELPTLADAALYRAKKEGRACFRLCVAPQGDVGMRTAA